MAHITKLKDRPSPWLATYTGPDRRRRRRSFRLKSDAERWLADQEGAKLRGAWIDPKRGRVTFGVWAERWLATMVHLKPKTRAGYRALLDHHLLPRWGDHPLEGLDPLDVREWAAGLTVDGMSASWARQAIRLLRAICESAVGDGRLVRNPCAGVKLPRIPRTEQRYITAAELEVLADAAGDYRVLVLVLGYGGLRWGEAVAVRRRRCDLLRSRLDVAEAVTEVDGARHYGETKNYRRRAVVLPAFLRDELAAHLAANDGEPDDLVFTNQRGAAIRHSTFTRRIWQPALVRAGIEPGLRIHDLRHTCASLLIAEGANIKAVQEHLGHSSATVTLDRYGHLYPDELDRLADALDAARARSVSQQRANTSPPEEVKPPTDLRKRRERLADS